jgi:hypothetical protein
MKAPPSQPIVDVSSFLNHVQNQSNANIPAFAYQITTTLKFFFVMLYAAYKVSFQQLHKTGWKVVWKAFVRERNSEKAFT